MPIFECVCGKSFSSSGSLKHHQNYRCRPTGPDDNVCRICERVFKSFPGVRQHMRRAHPGDYNEELQDEDKRVQRTWSAFENLQLARAEIAYSGYNVNQHLLTLFPDRTLDSIKGHRRMVEYKNLRDRIRAELEEAAEDEPNPEESLRRTLSPTVDLDERNSPNDNYGPLLFEAGPSQDPRYDEVHLESSVLSDDNIAVVEMPDAPPSPSPPPTPENDQLPALDPVRVYIDLLLGSMTLDVQFRENVDIVLNVNVSYNERRAAISYLWNNLGVLGVARAQSARVGGREFGQTFRNRRERYAFAQRLYRSDRSRLAEGLINDTLYTSAVPTFTVEDAHTTYSEILGTASPPDEDFISDFVDHDIEIYMPILIGELEKTLQARQSGSLGPDNVKINDLRLVPSGKLALIFNLVLFSCIIPDGWRANRTVLIPKSGCDVGDINTWRPLTISSIGLRVFNKIMAARFSKLPLRSEQRGFRSIDGTLANTLTLQMVVRECRAKAKPFSITTLDLRKAFDTVSHHSLLRALVRFKINPKVISLIKDNYTDSKTALNVNGVYTDGVSINRGVKQGDPLSPILFNLVLDEAISRLRSCGAGLDINGNKLVCLAYADDLILFSENKRDMQGAIRLLEKDLNHRGMSLNPRKCSNLTFNLLPNQSKLYLATREHIVIEGGLIRQLNVEDQFKYLGYNYGFMGARVSSVEDLAMQLDRIVKAPLKPQQKLTIIKQYLIPRYIYILQNPAITLKTLSSADRLVRLAVKRALHLPRQTSNAALYAPPRKGGLGVMSFRSRIPGILLTRINSLTSEYIYEQPLSSCLTSEYVLSLKTKLNIWCQTCGIFSAQVATYWGAKLEASASGGGLWQVGVAGASVNWVDKPPHYWTGEEYIKNIQLRFNLLPTKGGLHNVGGDTACRAGCARRETVCHVLQACPLTHFDRIRRHDKVVNKIATMARGKGLQAEIEPRFRDVRGQLHKPDLLLRRGNAVMIADVAIHWEGPDVLSISAGHKIARYSGPSFVDAVSTRYPGCIISIVPFVVGARGGWCSMNDTLVKFIGLNRSQIDLLVFMVMKGGWLIHSAFSARIWAHHHVG